MELHIDELEEAQAKALNAAKPPPRHPCGANAPRRAVNHCRSLPRETIEHDAACVCPNCGGRRLTRIGTDEREVLE